MNPENQEQDRSKLIIGVILGIIILLILIGVVFWLYRNKDAVISKAGGVLPFGNVTDTPRGTGSGDNTDSGTGDTAGGEGESMFRQLVKVPVAGSIPIVKDGDEYVRYIEKETGNVHDVRVRDGADTRMTNTTIPRVYEAYFGLNGSAVIFRYLDVDPLSQRDVIKTSLGYINLPANVTDGSGSVIIEFLPDDITDVSVSPNGKALFYLLKTAEGISGSTIDLATKNTREIFRNSFSEWLPALLDDGAVILTTKPSGAVAGFAYRYDPIKRTLERTLRNKLGLTTLPNSSGSRILYEENISRNVIFGVFDRNGFPGEEGNTAYESGLPISTLPEKCAWSRDNVHLYCASFSGNPGANIPDDWYQGTMAFKDTFWAVDTTTNEGVYIVDPMTAIKKSFDVIHPSLSTNEHYFIFVDKNDESLWAMTIPGPVQNTAVNAGPELSPSELKDAGLPAPQTSPATSSTATKKAAPVKK